MASSKICYRRFLLISIIQDDFGKNLEFMSYNSNRFFENVLNCFHTVIISKAVINEICKVTLLKEFEIIEKLSYFSNKIIITTINKIDINSAIKINEKYKIGRMDALHYIVAIKNSCDCILTWNKKHFVFAENELKIMNPRDL